MKKAYLNWSSGKDAAFALYNIQKEKHFEISKLVTTVNSEVDRVSMHGTRENLLIQQAESLQIPLQIIPLHGDLSMTSYNEVMKKHTSQLLNEGYTHSVFGDIFLQDLRDYREKQLQEIGMEAVFPLWKADTHQLIRDFLERGFKAITVSVNAKVLDKTFCGRILDMDFLKELPAHVDPCGENGEFHTFVFDGPNFRKPINFEIGEVVEKSYFPTEDKDDCFCNEKTTWDTSFYYCDLLPQG